MSQIKIDKQLNKIIRSQLHHISKIHQPHNISSACFSSSEVRNAIKELKAGKAPGKDGIHPELLHNLGPKIHLWIAEVFYAIYKSDRVPKSWKTANVIALLKPGKPADNPTSYRPISLLSVLSKLMERIILRRISPLIEPVYQAGFRYIDMPDTTSKKYAYADDTCIVSQSKHFEDVENTLTSDLTLLENVFKKWRLRPNPSKTMVTVFYLNNKEVNKELTVHFCGESIRNSKLPVYFWITLGRALHSKYTYKRWQQKPR